MSDKEKIDKSFESSSSSSEEEKRGQKRSISPNDDEECHFANKWESANLGDEDRNKKFLRLMGAGKKEHNKNINDGGSQHHRSGISKNVSDGGSQHHRAGISSDGGSQHRRSGISSDGGSQHRRSGVSSDGGSQHRRSDVENEKINKDLEDQFNSSMKDKLSGKRREHVGFGFQDPPDDYEEEERYSEIHKSSRSHYNKYDDYRYEEREPHAKKGLIGFVKSTDSS